MINIPKGTKDMLPSQAHKWHAVEKAAQKVAALYNVRQIRTPVFESADLFLRSIGDSTDIVNKEMYIFEDKGGRKLALRPEGTAGVMRSYIENNLGETLPLKVYYIESVYRYEQPQAGRYREHHQFGAEFFGSELPIFDTELLCLAHDYLKEVGFSDLVLHINSIGCPDCRAEFNAALRKFLDEHTDELCENCRVRAKKNPLRTLDCKNAHCRDLLKTAPKLSDFLCDSCKTHYAQVTDGLDACGIRYLKDENLVRGLDYYTRTVFEFMDGNLAVLAGGRYDGLCEQLGGKPTPCVGFGSGIERLIEAAESRGINFECESVRVFVAAQCESARLECGRLVRELRNAGIAAECDLMGKSLKAQFKYADKRGFGYTVTIGESELESGKYPIKNMKDGTTVLIDKNDLKKELGRSL